MPSIKKKPASKSPISPAKGRDKSAVSDPGEAAYERLRSRLTAITPDRVVQPRTDVRAAATFVLSDIAGRFKDATLRARFASLPAAEFDHSAVEDLFPAAQAALWAQAQLAVDEAGDLPVRLPVELVDESTALRTRMLEVCTYHFKGDSKLRLQVEDIRSGSGYVDLAEDLRRLGTLYTIHAQTLKQDLRFYNATDAQDALNLSQRITTEMRTQPGRAQAARELGWRTWALLQELYEEVARGGRFLLRQDGDAAFPSLHAVGRASKKRSAKPASDSAQPDDSRSPAV